MRLGALLMTIVAVTPPAVAGKLGGITMSDTLTIGSEQLVLNGMGMREATWLKVDVYVAGLYVETASSNPATLIAANETKMLVLRFKRDVDRGDIIKAWRDGFAGNATVPLASIESEMAQLDAWMPDMSKGDTLAFVFVPGAGVTVQINGTRKGTLAGEDFARSLLSIWLGPKPPTGALKRGLLGNHPQARS